ncbi:MAG: transposase [Rhodospirillaceae bacterium]|nr:MAG: transposase [Rhodospirillaceae bacterium]
MTALAITPDPQQYRFNRQDRITIRDISYICIDTDNYGHQFQRVDNVKIIETFTHFQIEELVIAGQLAVERNYFSPAAAKVYSITHGVTWDDLDDQEKHDIIWRMTFCDHFLRMETQIDWVNRSDDSMRRAIAEIQRLISEENEKGRSGAVIEVRRPPTHTTLLRWVNNYERGGYNKMALMNGRRRSGNDTPRLSSDVREIIHAKLPDYLDRRCPTVKNLYKQIKIEIDDRNKSRDPITEGKIPYFNIRSLYRLVEGTDKIHLTAGREGAETALKKHFITREGQPTYRLLERVEIDDWSVHMHVLLERAPEWKQMAPELKAEIARVRCNLTYAIDVASRCIVGAYMSTGKPDTANALRCLQMVVSNKTDLARQYGCRQTWQMCGRPENIVTDGGKNFVSNEFRAAALSIGGQAETTPGGVPQMRAYIERVFKTTDSSLLPHFTGRTFSNILQKGLYNSEADASLTALELNKAIIRWIVDIYHNTEHGGLGGQTPFNKWKSLMKEDGVEPPPPAEQIRHVFGTTIHKAITGKGVRFLNIFYQSEALQMIRREVGQKRVPVQIDQADLGSVSVKGKHGWISVPATKKMFEGVSVSQWKAAGANLRRQYVEEAKVSWPIVAEALRDIKALGDNAVKETGLAAPVITVAELKKIDRDIFKTFRIGEAYELTEPETVPDDIGVDGDGENEPLVPTEENKPKRSRPRKEPADDSEAPPSSTVGDESEWTIDD